MASTADGGSSVQPLRLSFDKGRANRRNSFVESPRLLATADNLEYRLGDNGVWVASPNLTVMDAIAGTRNSARSLAIFSLDDALELGIVHYWGFPKDYVRVSAPLGTDTVRATGDLNGPLTYGYGSSVPAEFIQFGNQIYVAVQADIGETQVLDLSDIGAPALRAWGGPWYAFRGDGDAHGYTGTKLKMVCEWTWGHPHDSTGVQDYVYGVRPRRAGTTTYTWRPIPVNKYMRWGPDADTGATSIRQPNWGHLFPASGMDSSDAMDYDVWLTEWDDVNKIETAFSVDVTPVEYEPQHFSGMGNEYSIEYDAMIDIDEDDTNSVHRLYQSSATVPWIANTTYWTTTQDPMRRSTAGTAIGGGNLMLRINKADIASTTTHIRVYMSRRGGTYPEGSRVRNDNLYLALDDLIGYTATDTTGTCGKALSQFNAFFNLPDDMPGIPVADTLSGSFEALSGGSVPDKNIVGIETLNVWNNDELYIYVLRPTEEFQTLGSDLFPTVESTVNGEGFILVPQDAPPPKCSFGIAFNNSIVTDDVDNPGLVRWSVADKPDSFPATYFYDLNDAFVAARKLGRYLMLFGRNKLVLARYLVYDDVSAESIGGAFLEVDSTRGAAARDLTCSFTHPTLGPSVAYADDAGELWMSNGGLPRQITPHFDFTPELWRWDKARLVNNPAKQRLELHFHEETKQSTAALGSSTAYFAISYHPEHALSAEVFNVMGPIELADSASRSGVFVDMASNAAGAYGLDMAANIQRVGAATTEDLTAGTGRADLVSKLVSHVINPVGLSKDWMIYSLRVAHRFTNEGTSLTLRAYNHGDQTYDSHNMAIAGVVDAGVQHHNGQLASEGLKVDMEGMTFGSLDAVELDVDTGVGPLSD